MMRLRLARPDDLGALDALFARAYPRLLAPDYPAHVMVTAVPIIARAQPALLASGTYWVAEDAGDLIGAGGWTAAIPGNGTAEPGRANVRHVVTDDRRVRQGTGRAILTVAFDQARAAGMTWMHCLSTRTAAPFYAALGFIEIGKVEVPLAPGITLAAIEMRRDL